MKQLKNPILILLTSIFLTTGCGKEKVGIDTEYPVIDITGANAFPVQCSSIARGQKINFRARFSDNAALGSYSIDIHHNFDHHSHSTEVQSCQMGPVKTPVKPLLYINTFTIPEGSKTYEATAEITIPADVDPGDYHFLIKVTDKEGWQTLRGISIKIV
ncbi:MAG: DUF4625 domain-containing protein [Pedobacter sp.]|nr:MAG: DUF4625 domain-containing protein [Pedobacter sp.]